MPTFSHSERCGGGIAVVLPVALLTALACSSGPSFEAARSGPDAGAVGGESGSGGSGAGGNGGTGGTDDASSTGGASSGGAASGGAAGTAGTAGADAGAGVCEGDAQCSAGERCVLSVCRRECDSDNDCTSLGLLCDPALGVCTSCVNHADCPDSAHCAGGACRPDVCAPGQATCHDNAVALCTAAGDRFGEPVACGSQQTCVGSGQAASCVDWLCTPNAPGCQENVQVVCSDDGLSFVPGADCGLSGLYCAAGECRAQVCQPNQYLCRAKQLERCAADGLSSTVVQVCTDAQYCDPVSASCRALTCTPNQPACNGNIATSCNAGGTGYVPGGTNCSLSGQACAAGECTSSVVDVVAEGSSSTITGYTNYVKVNFFRVDSSRTLTGIEMYLDTTETSLTWLVYESTTQLGTYANVLSVATPNAGSGARFHSSGPLNVPLVAGRFYAIGVHFAASTVYYFESAAQPQSVSFGAMISAATPSTATPPTSLVWAQATYGYWQRLLTAP